MPTLPTKTEVITHRSTRKLAEAYIARFADCLGEQTHWNGREALPCTIVWEPVKVATGGYDVVSTVTYPEAS